MQLYLTPRHNANAFASTFLFFATHKANVAKIKKSLQANTQRQTVMDRHITTEKKQRTANSTYPKGGVSCFKDSFVVNGSSVFQIKFCGKSPALLVDVNRYQQG